MRKIKSNIYSSCINKIFFVVLVCIGFWYLTFIQGEYSTFKTESLSLRATYQKDQETMLKRQVTGLVDYINDMRLLADHELSDLLRARVDNAHKVAMNIYKRNMGGKTLSEIAGMIKDALRPVVFDKVKGSYFAISVDGIDCLSPIRPDLEGKNIMYMKDISKNDPFIRGLIEIIGRKKRYGFVKRFYHHLSKDRPLKRHCETFFVKYFKPLKWYIGTNIDCNNYEKQVKKKILFLLSDLRFGRKGYCFGSTYSGAPLFSNGRIKSGTVDILKTTDSRGVKIISRMQKIVENSKGSFIRCSWKRNKTSESLPEILFIKPIPDLKWIIGAGANFDGIDKVIARNKALLHARFKNALIRGVLVLLFLLCLIYFWSRRLSDKIRQSIDTSLSFLMQAGESSKKVNSDDIPIEEFKELALSINKILEQIKQGEEQLQKSEEKYRSIFENAVEGFFQSSPKGHFISVNPSFAKIFDYNSPEEMIRSVSDIATQCYADPEDRELYKQLLHTSGFVKNFEFQAKRKDGSLIWVSVSSRVIRGKDGKVVRYEGNAVDITYRQRIEAEHDRLIAAIEQVAEAVIITDINGTILYVNSVFEKITGYTRQEAIGENPRILKSGQQDELFYRDMWETITSGDTWHGRIVNKRKNGIFYTEETSISPVFDMNMGIVNFVAVKRDITNEIMMEKMLLHSQKMESIGTLAGGIAHDFNNILFPIVGHAEILMEDIPETSPFYESLKSIHESSLRAMDLVKQILIFARHDNIEMKSMKIQPVIKEVLKLIRATLPVTIKINQNIRSDCGMIMANPTQIHQIVMNLATNAYHAMEKTGGEMKIALREVELDEAYVANYDIKPGSYACLTVSDTGIGMDKYVMERIFEPFFTTKDKSRGTGMGLSVVHGIVKSAGGRISVNSEPGKGTEFNVYFPVIETLSRDINTTYKTPVIKGIGHVMLVDDEEEIIKIEEYVLERLGYKVTSYTSSLDALEFFRKNYREIDIVITDLSMPGLQGDELTGELLRICPDIPILLCTGFSESISREQAISLGIKDMLLKPVVMRELAAKISGILKKSRS